MCDAETVEVAEERAEGGDGDLLQGEGSVDGDPLVVQPCLREVAALGGGNVVCVVGVVR